METFIVIWLIVNVGAFLWWVKVITDEGDKMTLKFKSREISGLARAVVVGLIAVFFIPIVIFCGEIG